MDRDPDSILLAVLQLVFLLYLFDEDRGSLRTSFLGSVLRAAIVAIARPREELLLRQVQNEEHTR